MGLSKIQVQSHIAGIEGRLKSENEVKYVEVNWVIQVGI